MGNCLRCQFKGYSFLIDLKLPSPCRTASTAGSPPPYQERVQMPASQPMPTRTDMGILLTEEEQVQLAMLIGLVEFLPCGKYDSCRDGPEKTTKECVICLTDFIIGDPIRLLPCMHFYHVNCINDWLIRSFTCPSCLEPINTTHLSS